MIIPAEYVSWIIYVLRLSPDGLGPQFCHPVRVTLDPNVLNLPDECRPVGPEYDRKEFINTDRSMPLTAHQISSLSYYIPLSALVRLGVSDLSPHTWPVPVYHLSAN
jgi:hypothetical protein